MRVLTLIMIKRLMQKNTAELTERWRKQIKLSALSSLTERLKVQEKKKMVLKLKAKR
jgi:carboxyl-terminal processing protease